MGEMGFGARASASAKKEEETLEDIQEMLQGIEAENNSIQSDLQEEIKNLKRLKRNVKILEKKIAFTEKIAEKRKKLLIELFVLVDDPSFETDVAENIFNKIQHYDQLITQEIRLVAGEIKRYILNEAHQIFAENANKAEEIQNLDRIARMVQAKIYVISNEIGSHNQQMQEVVNKIRIRKGLRKTKSKGIGFE